MNPAVISLIIGLVEMAIKYQPQIAAELKAIFEKENPTPEDWMVLKAKVLTAKWEDLAPDAEV